MVDRNDDGRGRGEFEGRVALVAQAIPGDVVQVRVDKKTRNTIQGRVGRLVTPSKNRVSTPCPHQFHCTGCALLGTRRGDELQLKEAGVVRALKEGSSQGAEKKVHGIEEVGSELAYRHFAKQIFALEKGKVILGAYVAGTHEVADNDGCPILAPHVSKVSSAVLAEVRHRGLRIHWRDETGLRYLALRGSRASGNVLVTLVSSKPLTGPWLSQLQELGASLVDERAAVSGVAAIFNDDPGNVLLLGPSQVLAGENGVDESILGFTHRIGPQSFFQINPVTAERMFERALEFAGSGEQCLELFSGVGVMTLPLRRGFKEVVAVENNVECVDALKAHLEAADLDGVEVIEGDAFTLGPKLLADGAARVVVADPPRKGLGESLIQAFGESQIERLVYLSCQPSVLKRDLPLLEKGGFVLEDIALFDQFPGTIHVETVALFVKVKSSPS